MAGVALLAFLCSSRDRPLRFFCFSCSRMSGRLSELCEPWPIATVEVERRQRRMLGTTTIAAGTDADANWWLAEESRLEARRRIIL